MSAAVHTATTPATVSGLALVDLAQHAVRDLGPHDAQVHHAGQAHVADVARGATQERHVLVASDRGADAHHGDTTALLKSSSLTVEMSRLRHYVARSEAGLVRVRAASLAGRSVRLAARSRRGRQGPGRRPEPRADDELPPRPAIGARRSRSRAGARRCAPRRDHRRDRCDGAPSTPRARRRRARSARTPPLGRRALRRSPADPHAGHVRGQHRPRRPGLGVVRARAAARWRHGRHIDARGRATLPAASFFVTIFTTTAGRPR